MYCNLPTIFHQMAGKMWCLENINYYTVANFVSDGGDALQHSLIQCIFLDGTYIYMLAACT